ncbi:MAG: PfkB family carbohydrate kinase [Phycisphaeraceae bacterium]
MSVDLDQLRPGATLMVRGWRWSLGGNAGRCAATLSALGVQVTLLGDLGADPDGDLLLGELARVGVGVGEIHRHQDTETSTTLSLVQPDGERTLLHDAGANAKTEVSALDRLDEQLKDNDILFLSGARLMPCLGVSGAAALLKSGALAGALTIYDTTVNPAGANKESLMPLLAGADIFCTSMGEAREDWSVSDAESLTERLVDQARGWVVVKDGSRGAIAGHRDEGLFHCKPSTARAQDTTGAGDSFMAGLIYAISTGRELPLALAYGVAGGSASVSSSGDLYKSISPEQLDELVSELAPRVVRTPSLVTRSS